MPGDVLTRLCPEACHILIAAPYIKAAALSRVLADANADARIVCITRWDPYDIASGVSDIECRSIVIDRGGSFRLHPTLHAKFYRIDDVSLVGSANLTSAGMGWSEQSNVEILCRPEQHFDADRFQERLLRESREISDREQASWEQSVTSGVVEGSLASKTRPALSKWRPATRDPRHLEMAYEARKDNIASLDEQRAAESDLTRLLVPEGLTTEEMRKWVAVWLLAAPFTSSVIQLSDLDLVASAKALADQYGLEITEARRDMETVQNWLAFLAPGTLPRCR